MSECKECGYRAKPYKKTLTGIAFIKLFEKLQNNNNNDVIIKLYNATLNTNFFNSASTLSFNYRCDFKFISKNEKEEERVHYFFNEPIEVFFKERLNEKNKNFKLLTTVGNQFYKCYKCFDKNFESTRKKGDFKELKLKTKKITV